MALLAVMAALAAPATAQPAIAAPPDGCGHVHPAADARTWLRTYVRSDRPWLNQQRIRHIRRCVPTQARRRALRTLTRQWIAWRQTYAPSWRIRFNRLAPWERAWAWNTGACESGNNPRIATGNGYYGAHQWLPSTWAAADHTGIWVTNATWHHQAVVAVRWMHRAGATQWPNCG